MLTFGKNEEEKARLMAMEENYAIISFKPDGTILHANKNFLDAVQYNLDEIVGNHHEMFCAKSYTSTKKYSNFWKDLADGKSQIDEFERFKKDGSSFWIQASYTPVKNSNGKVIRVVKFAQDITDTKNVINNAKKVIDLSKTGNLKERINQTTKNKDVEELKNSINELLEFVSLKVDSDLNRISDILYSFKKLDFTKKIKGNLGEVAVGLNDFADIINDMLLENKANGLTLDKSSDMLLSNVDILNKNSNESAAALEETAAALEEITSNISSNTQNVINMSKYASQVTSSANEGKELAHQTARSMSEIDSEVRAIDEAIIVIDQISFQTNILSLNAAVEAATAGEAGKGFAVVAQEVRNLANRSAEAAKEIKALVENATLKANNGREISDKMITGYGVLNDNISETIKLISNIESASKEQQQGIVQISDAINSLDNQTQQNASVATKTHIIAEQTDKIAKLIVEEANKKQFIGKDSVKAKDIID